MLRHIWLEESIDRRVNVKCHPGVLGDGVHDDTDGLNEIRNVCFGTAENPHGRNSKDNLEMFFPSGDFRVRDDGLLFSKVQGGLITGSGNLCTKITNVTGGAVIRTNGFSYSTMRDLALYGQGVLCDLNYDGTPGGDNLQSNNFYHVFHSGGTIGTRVGFGQFMGSENKWFNCQWEGCSDTGIGVYNYNALCNALIGCNAASCGVAVNIVAGAIACDADTSFQANGWDIVIANSAWGTFKFHCRTESLQFCKAGNGAVVTLVGCSQVNKPIDAPNVVFFEGAFPGAILNASGCNSAAGQITGYVRGSVSNSSFGNVSVAGVLASPYSLQLNSVMANDVFILSQTLQG